MGLIRCLVPLLAGYRFKNIIQRVFLLTYTNIGVINWIINGNISSCKVDGSADLLMDTTQIQDQNIVHKDPDIIVSGEFENHILSVDLTILRHHELKIYGHTEIEVVPATAFVYIVKGHKLCSIRRFLIVDDKVLVPVIWIIGSEITAAVITVVSCGFIQLEKVIQFLIGGNSIIVTVKKIGQIYIVSTNPTIQIGNSVYQFFLQNIQNHLVRI